MSLRTRRRKQPPDLGPVGADNLHRAGPLNFFLASLPPVGVHAFSALLDDKRLVPLVAGVHGGAAHAVITREADDIDVGDFAGPQGAGQLADADPEGVVKGRVHLHAGVGALFGDGVETIDGELGDERRPRRVLDAVDWPEAGGVGLGWVEGVDYGGGVDEGTFFGVVGGEGDVVGGVPVLGGDAEGEGRGGEEVVDEGDDGAALGDGEGAVLEGVSGLVVSLRGDEKEGNRNE